MRNSSYQIRQLPCRARGARAHKLCSYLPFRMDSFGHGNVFFLLSVKWWCVQYKVTNF